MGEAKRRKREIEQLKARDKLHVTGGNDPFWNRTPDFGFTKYTFTERWTREAWRKQQATHGEKASQADVMYDLYSTMEHWISHDYWVVLDKQCLTDLFQTFNGHTLWHLTIGDSEVNETKIRDWQIFQAIKNEVVGPEFEAIELYPAHSRLMDAANKYHLYILAPNENEETPPQFKIGGRKGGILTQIILIDETFAKTSDTEKVAELLKSHNDSESKKLIIFPESLRGAVGRECPRFEPAMAMFLYVEKHPEIRLQSFEEWAAGKDGSSNWKAGGAIAFVVPEDGSFYPAGGIKDQLRTFKQSQMLMVEKGLKDHIEETKELSKQFGSLWVFPETLRSEVEREFPDIEYGRAITRYSQKHPELEVQSFENWLDTDDGTSEWKPKFLKEAELV